MGTNPRLLNEPINPERFVHNPKQQAPLVNSLKIYNLLTEEEVDTRIHTDSEVVVPEDPVEAYDYQEASEDTADSLDPQVAVGNSAAGTADVRNVAHLAKDAVNKPEAVQMDLVEQKFASLRDEIVEVHIHSEAVEGLVEKLDLGVDPKEVGNHLEQDWAIVVAEAEEAFEKVAGLVEVVDEAGVEVDEADAKDVVAGERDEDSDVEVDAEDETAGVEIGEEADEEAGGNRMVQVQEEGSFHPGREEEVHRWLDKSGWRLMVCWWVDRSGRRCWLHSLAWC